MSSHETPAFTYKLVTPGSVLAVPRKVLMQETLETERKPSNTAPAPIKYSNWEAAGVSMGFTTTIDDEGKIVETASNQMINWLVESDGPFWSSWVEYCAWDTITERSKPRTWRHAQVVAAKDSLVVKEMTPKWSSVRAPQFIARLVVRFFHAVNSSPAPYRFQSDDENEGFRHAFSICQFVKDNASATSALAVDEDELTALREVINAHKSSRKRSAKDALDEKSKADINDHTEEYGQAKDNASSLPKRARAE